MAADNPFAWLKHKAAEVQVAKDQDVTTALMFLPGLEELMRVMPNQIARSSLFAPIAHNRRKFHQNTPLITRSDAAISYTGEQLDEADADLCMQLIFEARAFPLGMSVALNRAALLEAMGRHTGNTQYEWLHRRMKALTAATVLLEAKRQDGSSKYRIGHTKAFHILADFAYDECTEVYTYMLDPRWRALFGNREYALINWQKRLQIGRGQDMAKTLQRLVATSADQVQRYELDWLKLKMEYKSPKRKFRESLEGAMQELRRLDIIVGGRIERSTKGKDQLVLKLNIIPASRFNPRHSVPPLSA